MTVMSRRDREGYAVVDVSDFFYFLETTFATLAGLVEPDASKVFG